MIITKGPPIGFKAVILQDNREESSKIKDYLENLGFTQVSVVNSCQEGLESYTSCENTDLMIIDYDMKE